MRRLSSRSTWLQGEGGVSHRRAGCGKRGEDVPDGHPLKVGPHGIHLALVNRDGRAVRAERLFGVVQGTESVPVAVVGNLYWSFWLERWAKGMHRAVHTVVVPGRHPGVVLSQELQVGIGAVLLFCEPPLLILDVTDPSFSPAHGEFCSPTS